MADYLGGGVDAGGDSGSVFIDIVGAGADFWEWRDVGAGDIGVDWVVLEDNGRYGVDCDGAVLGGEYNAICEKADTSVDVVRIDKRGGGGADLRKLS